MMVSNDAKLAAVAIAALYILYRTRTSARAGAAVGAGAAEFLLGAAGGAVTATASAARGGLCTLFAPGTWVYKGVCE